LLFGGNIPSESKQKVGKKWQKSKMAGENRKISQKKLEFIKNTP